MAPTNDNFASATTISGNSGSITGTTYQATKEASEVNMYATDQSVWYTFTPSVTSWFKFWVDKTEVVPHPGRGLLIAIGPQNTLASFTTANVLEVYGHYPTLLVEEDITVAAKLTSGTQYWIKLSSTTAFGGTDANTCDFTLRWTNFTPPANDDFSNAVTLSNDVAVTASTRDATPESGEVSGWGGSGYGVQTRWYKFTPSVTD
jgi:hypothetical protein